MNQQKRELKQNELAKAASQASVIWADHGTKIVIGVAAALVLLCGYLYWDYASRTSAEETWGKIFSARSQQQYAEVADDKDTKGTIVGQWARLKSAQAAIESGIEQSFSNREASDNSFTTAQEELKLLVGNDVPVEIRKRALFALGTVQESTNQPKEALESYQSLLSLDEDGFYADELTRRIARTKKDSTKEFYAWFDKQTPSPAGRGTPNDPKPSGSDAFPDVLNDPVPTGTPDIPDELRPEGLGFDGEPVPDTGSSDEAGAEKEDGGDETGGPMLIPPTEDQPEPMPETGETEKPADEAGSEDASAEEKSAASDTKAEDESTPNE